MKLDTKPSLFFFGSAPIGEVLPEKVGATPLARTPIEPAPIGLAPVRVPAFLGGAGDGADLLRLPVPPPVRSFGGVERVADLVVDHPDPALARLGALLSGLGAFQQWQRGQRLTSRPRV